ncbi:hypothetical protein [Endozoicomonas sp. Mp262]|uniref:hypothetical protein n=1 Tax=Endozoicomonas sp. Mp262 TaxID=2919499 RepID=UPI0021DA2390
MPAGIWFAGIADELHVKGDLNLLGRITKYPKRIFVSGSLVINRHDESILTEEHSSLLENVSIDAGLNFFITGNNLLKLPHSVRARSINIKKCSKLSSLPEGMNGISINVSECHQLVNLPKQIHAYLVVIEDCDGLRELPLNCPFSNDFLNHGSIELAFKRCHNLQQQIPDNWSGIPFQSLMVTFDVSDKDRCDLWLQHKRRCKLNGSCDCEVPVIGGGLSQSN